MKLLTFVYQFVAAFSATLYVLSTAIAFGWNSPSLPKLFAENSPLKITIDESSWIVSMLQIGTVVAPIPAAWMMDRFGRKITLLIGTIPLILGWILIGVGKSVPVLYVARIMSGFSYGLAYCVTPMYLAEIASDTVRGAISITLTIMAKLGILYAFVIGPYVSFRMMAWLALIPVALFLASSFWLPETPYFYLDKNRKEEARQSLMRLRNGQLNVEEELNRMEVAVKMSKENKGTFRKLFSTKGNRRGLIIISGLGIVQQLCGSQAIIAYSEIIFQRMGTGMQPSTASIVLAVVQLLSAAFSSMIVDTLGRRPLLLTSVVGTALCNMAVGMYFYLEKHNDVSWLAWVPMVAIMMFVVFYTFGLATVTFTVLGEIFPKNLKAVASAAFIIATAILAFATTKLFQVMSDGLGTDYTFFGYAFISFIFIPFVWFLVPETKGKSLELILRELNGK